MQPASEGLAFHVQEVLREKARDGDDETRLRLADIAGDLKVLGDEAALVLRSDIPGLGAGHTTPRLLSWLLLGELSAAERSEISDPLARVTQLLQQTSAAPRKCGKIFKSGEIIWHCRTCQSDDTCVLCQECFDGGDHTGHEVFFHRTKAGGCCDCGDLEAWKLEGCCARHRGAAPADESAPALPDELAGAARAVIGEVVRALSRCRRAAEASLVPDGLDIGPTSEAPEAEADAETWPGWRLSLIHI